VPLAEYSARRHRLADALRDEVPAGEMGVLLLRSLPKPENATFRQESNLYYLTGTEIPGSALVLLFDHPAPGTPDSPPSTSGARYAEYFYLPERDFRQERWTGAKLGAGSLEKDTLRPDAERLSTMRLTGFDKIPEGDFPPRWLPRGPVEKTSDFRSHLKRFLESSTILFFGADPGTLGEPLSEDLAFLEELRTRYSNLRTRDPRPALGRLRMIKSEAEVAQIRHAVEITCQAMRDGFRAARSGVPEYQVQAEIERRFTREGARRPGYPSIVGSGLNSCVLHYDANERTLRHGDLLLMDVGAEYRRYTADVTRTIPVGGRFSSEQRKVYDVVLKAQEAVFAAIKPGIAFSELDKTARRVISDAGYGQYFNHATSHFLGLDVHDAGDGSSRLAAGMVFTVEPGIYIPEKELGIRIEDDVVVTETGVEVLSLCLPRKADAVEMQTRKASRSGTR
jgi:Xaa-Pro aminopeptidase